MDLPFRYHVRVLAAPDPEQVGVVGTLSPGSELCFGRDPGHGLRIDDPQLSRRHFSVSRDGTGRMVVEDHQTTNGTYCNRVPLVGAFECWSDVVIRAGKTVVHVGRSLPEAEQPAVLDPLLRRLADGLAQDRCAPIRVSAAPGCGMRTLAREINRRRGGGPLTILSAASWDIDRDMSPLLPPQPGGTILVRDVDSVYAPAARALVDRATEQDTLVIFGGRMGRGNSVVPKSRRIQLPALDHRKAAVWGVTRGLIDEARGGAPLEVSGGAIMAWLSGPFHEGWSTVKERLDRLLASLTIDDTEVRTRHVHIAFGPQETRDIGPSRSQVVWAVAEADDKTAAAKLLGVSRSTLYRLIERLGVDVK